MGRSKCFNRSEVLDKAIQVFWRKGFSETSLHDLEKATGVNKSGLYSEFLDKDDLFSECINQYVKNNGVLDVLAKEPLGRENIENFLLSGQRCSEAKGCLVANTFREMSIVPQKAKNHIELHVESVKRAILNNVKALPTTSPAMILVELILTYNTGVAIQLNAGEIKGLKKQIHEFLDLILK